MSTLTATYPLHDFHREPEEHLRRLRASGEAEVLTVDGEPALVVQALESYRRLLAIVERADAIQGIRRGLASKHSGEGRPAAEVLAEMRNRHGIDPNA